MTWFRLHKIRVQVENLGNGKDVDVVEIAQDFDLPENTPRLRYFCNIRVLIGFD